MEAVALPDLRDRLRRLVDEALQIVEGGDISPGMLALVANARSVLELLEERGRQ